MSDQETLIKAIEDARAILKAYVDPGPRNPHVCIQKLQVALGDPRLTSAIDRIKAGYGLRVIK